MNKISWILFCLTAILLVVKLVLILSEQIGMLQMLRDVGNWDGYWIALYFKHYWLFVEPTLILISLTGFAVRRKIGFQLSLIFTYFVLGYALLHYLTPIDRHANFHFGLVTWALLVTILINVPAITRVFSTELTNRDQFRFNIIALLIGLTLNGGLLIVTAD